MNTSILNEYTDINKKLPSGEWTLWYHSPREKNWGLNSYTEIHTVSTINEFFSLLNIFGDVKLLGGTYFLMRKGVMPLWENHHNIKGGSYSLRSNVDTSIELFITYALGAMLNIATLSPDDKITGIHISPKLVGHGNRDKEQLIGFSTIKIWNADCTRFGKSSGIRILNKNLTHATILYTPHNEKKM